MRRTLLVSALLFIPGFSLAAGAEAEGQIQPRAAAPQTEAAPPAPAAPPSVQAPAVPAKPKPAAAAPVQVPVPAAAPAPATAPAPAKAAPAAAPAPAAPAAQAAPAQASPAAPAAQPGAPPAEKKDESAEAAQPDRALERAKGRIQEIEARTDLAPAVRDQALALAKSALGFVEGANASEEAAKRFQDAIKRAQDRSTDAKQQLDALKAETGDDGFATGIGKLALPEAQQALDAANSDAATIKTDLDQLEQRLRDANSRAPTAREEQSAEKQALDALENAPDAQPGDEQVVIETRRAAIAAERRARAAKLNMLEQELISLPSRQASLTVRRDLASMKLDKLQKRLPVIEARVNYLKEVEASKRQEKEDLEAKKLAAQHPVLEAFVKDTAVIRDRLDEVERGRDADKARLGEIKSDIARVGESKAAALQVLEIGAVGGDFGELLRTMRGQLPSHGVLERSIAERDEALVDARLKRLQAEEARRIHTDVNGMAERVLAASRRQGEPEPGPDVLPALQKLVAARRDLYIQLQDALVTRVAQLAEVNAAERDLYNQATQLRSLLNSRLLWLPSSAPIGMRWVNQVVSSLAWFVDPEGWQQTGAMLLDRAMARPFKSGAVLVAVVLLFAFGRRIKARLAQIAEALGRYSTDSYWRTPEAVSLTALLAIRTPLVFGYAGYLLTQPPQVSEFTAGVGAGLLTVASLLAFLRFVQGVALETGLFSVHFGWSERARVVLATNTAWLKYGLILPAFVLAMIGMTSAQGLRDGVGRFAFLVGGVLASIFFARVMDARRGVFAEAFSANHPLWVTRYVWFALFPLMPLGIAGLALWGYYDGASQIQTGLALSVAIVCGAFLIYSVTMREVLVARRRLEVRRAAERREKARQQRAAEEANGEFLPPAGEDVEVDIASISEQTRKLVRLVAFLLLGTGLYFFWREALPSLALLDVPLWQQSVTIDGAVRSMPVTVSDVIMAIVIGFVTVIATRNLPGLLEITALHRLRVEAGTRYAIGAVSRYLIAIFGIILAFRSIGFDWSQVQWIVAALGVGVGFGLQEIVANFISGLIILFERPVRVGDTVTIGNLTGTVSRIHIRATSMTDGENREIIIPNKSLITDKVINWTLTDSITRVTFKISIAYGTDTLKAQMLILEAVKATPQVLDKPAPSVFFSGFGSSSLEFEVRAFVLQLAHRVTVLNDLHVAIERSLREHEIAMS